MRNNPNEFRSEIADYRDEVIMIMRLMEVELIGILG